MELSQLIPLAIDFGITPLNLVLVGMLYIMLADSGKVPKFWKKQEAENEDIPTLHTLNKKMSHLLAHYNDETTENLELIGRNQATMIKLAEETNKKVESIRIKQDEFDRFGIKVRQTV